MISGRLFVSRLAFAMGVVMRDASRRETRSKTIERSLDVIVLDFGRVAVETPYFWAVYYHNGRGPVRARPGHKLVYFKNPDQDPRIPNRRYPVRAKDIRRLTKAQFYRYLNDPNSGMIVRDSVGPWEGDPFFDRAARVFPARASAMAQRAFSKHVIDTLGDDRFSRITETIII